MTYSISSSTRTHSRKCSAAFGVSGGYFKAVLRIAVTLAILLLVVGCSSHHESVKEEFRPRLIAVLPVENLSGSSAPLKEIRSLMMEELRRQGFAILDDATLEKYMADNRIRYIRGISGESAESLRKGTGVDALLMTSLELYGATVPPRIALVSRLMTASEHPEIIWMHSVALAGNDAPGFLSFGLIDDAKKLTAKGVRSLLSSLVEQSRGYVERTSPQRRFKPRASYVNGEAKERKRVAVVPFVNASDRKNAGDIVALHFVEQLHKAGFRVIEPGMVREKLLRFRVIMEGGMSISNANVLFSELEADLVVTGNVNDYQDPADSSGTPKVNFSAIFLKKEGGEVVSWSQSHNEGNEGIRLFNIGSYHVAHAMAAEMARAVVAGLANHQ